MPVTFQSLLLRNQRDTDRRLVEDHVRLAREMAVRMATYANADGTLPDAKAVRRKISRDVWESVLKPYYVGDTGAALNGADPNSPYARVVVQGIQNATRIQVERQAALVRRAVNDPAVAEWLTGPRPAALQLQPQAQPSGAARFAGLRNADGRIDFARARADLVRPRGFYDPHHKWVDPNGYRLSDRVWNVAGNTRARIDRLLDYHISRGTSAKEIARALEQFLTPAAQGQKTVKPYGTEGSYAARRLARTEITVAAHRATVNAARVNPMVKGVQWRLSASHPKRDICDDYARGGANQDGIYPPEAVPAVPHPNCLCTQVPVTLGDREDVVNRLRDQVRAARNDLFGAFDASAAAQLQGILNPEFLTKSIMEGTLSDSVRAAVTRVQLGVAVPGVEAGVGRQAVGVPRFADKKQAAQWLVSEGYAEAADFGKIELSAIQDIADRAVYHMERFPLIKGHMKFIGSAQARNRIVKEAARAAIENDLREFYRKVYPNFTGERLEKEVRLMANKRLARVAPKVPGNAWAMAYNDQVVFNEKFSSNIADMVGGLIRSEQAGFHPPGANTVASVVDHEFGHILDNVYKVTKGTGTEAGDKLVEMYRLANDNGGVKKAVSTYAATNNAEFWAESWAEYLNSDNPRAVSKAWGDWFIAFAEGK